MAKKGDRIEGVERYPNGRIKYEQDHKAIYEANKGRRVMVGVKLSPDLANQFNAKLEAEGSNKNAKIKSWIADYLAGKLK